MAYSEELCASVIGFSNNHYRCCETIEEGLQALSAFRASRALAPSPAPNNAPSPAPVTPAAPNNVFTSIDDSWWCCIAGAEPGVYHGM